MAQVGLINVKAEVNFNLNINFNVVGKDKRARINTSSNKILITGPLCTGKSTLTHFLLNEDRPHPSNNTTQLFFRRLNGFTIIDNAGYDDDADLKHKKALEMFRSEKGINLIIIVLGSYKFNEKDRKKIKNLVEKVGCPVYFLLTKCGNDKKLLETFITNLNFVHGSYIYPEKAKEFDIGEEKEEITIDGQRRSKPVNIDIWFDPAIPDNIETIKERQRILNKIVKFCKYDFEI